jgi:hypothetical protein
MIVRGRHNHISSVCVEWLPHTLPLVPLEQIEDDGVPSIVSVSNLIPCDLHILRVDASQRNYGRGASLRD